MATGLERWRRIKDWPQYEVSSLGRIRRDGKIRVPYRGRYLSMVLYKTIDGPTVFKKVYLHIVVCEAFHGPKPSPKHEVAHWDGDPYNNGATNLRWATKSEQYGDKVRHGRTGLEKRRTGFVLTPNQAGDIKARLSNGESCSSLAREYGISIPHVSGINRGKSWVAQPPALLRKD